MEWVGCFRVPARWVEKALLERVPHDPMGFFVAVFPGHADHGDRVKVELDLRCAP